MNHDKTSEGEGSTGSANEREEWQGPAEAEDEVLTTGPKKQRGVWGPAGTAPVGGQANDAGQELPGLASAVRTPVPPGRLPTARLLVASEVLAGVIVAEAACAVLMIVLAFAVGLAELPTPVAEYPALSAAVGGLLVGGYVLSRRRSMRLARRKHLQGGMGGPKSRRGEAPTRGWRRWL